ncbi:hypothetical protein [Runella sp. SP2]|uniref:hypothetical protein n=1 Tax=Runella sp. SP2 TaxID=2268026 RepID=UPI000F0804CC|nr:hypothetical protein [Runella sp. SP2]AYQ31176.1 hypothetical protein DTQ70_02840 [Runella sp. SP2]
MKKAIITLIFVQCVAFASQAQYNNWAIGFQLVEPSGLNVRKYYGDNKALDVSFGTYGLFYGRDRKYRKGFYQNAGFSLRVNHLWHTALFKKEQFRAYYGFGGQINSRRYYFDSRNSPGTKEFTNSISLGGSGLAGTEYFVSNSPLSCFLETGLYVELVPGIFFVHPQASLGVRFNF